MSGSVLSALSLLFAARQGRVGADVADASVADIAFTGIDGEALPLSAYRGRPLIVVNTASRCGFREQMDELRQLQREYADQGLEVLCLPSGDFWNQEADDGEIREVYRAQLGFDFPLTRKVVTRGLRQHAFFARVGGIAGPGAVPKWNFYKYVIDPNGKLVAWFSTPIRPSSWRIRAAIEGCL